MEEILFSVIKGGLHSSLARLFDATNAIGVNSRAMLVCVRLRRRASNI